MLSRNGFAGTTISQITKASGKPASSIYWQFSTKDELVAAALEGTYQRSAEGMERWPDLDTTRSISEQLEDILTPAFISSESEDPVRLGLMVALEGKSLGSVAREPFAKRRRRARESVCDWWATAAHEFTENRNPELLGNQMTALTLALLDGHYMGDVDAPDEALSQLARGKYAALALEAAFELLGKSSDLFIVVKPERAELDSADTAKNQELLVGTRALVAERGYHGATLNRICERSGMQRSSVYWRYKDKDQLISAAVSEPFLKLARESRPPTSDQVPELAEFAYALTNSVESAMRDRSAAAAGLLLKLQRRTPVSLASETILRGMHEHRSELHNSLSMSQVLRNDDFIEAFSWLLRTLWEGLMLGVAFRYRYDLQGLTKCAMVMFQRVSEHEPDLAPSPRKATKLK